MGKMLLVSPISLAVSFTEETLSVLSSRFQVVPPLVEIRKPTPGASVASSPLMSPPVAAMMIDSIGIIIHREDRDAADVDGRS